MSNLCDPRYVAQHRSRRSALPAAEYQSALPQQPGEPSQLIFVKVCQCCNVFDFCHFLMDLDLTIILQKLYSESLIRILLGTKYLFIPKCFQRLFLLHKQGCRLDIEFQARTGYQIIRVLNKKKSNSDIRPDIR